MLGNTKSGKFLKKNNLRQGFGNARALAVLATVIGLATATLALEDTPVPVANPTGLAGILPEAPPASLNDEAFGTLGESWAAWSEGAAAAVEELYKSPDVAAQRKALAAARSKVKVMDTALKDSRYAKIALPLAGLSRELTRRLDVAEAILDTVELDPTVEHPKRLKSKADAVLSAADALSKSLAGVAGGKAWLPFVKSEELVAALKADPAGAAAVAAAKASQAKLASRTTLEKADQKAFLSRPAFVTLESALTQYLNAAENPPAADTADKLKEQFAALVKGLDEFEAGGTTAGATQARQAYAAIRKLAADGGDRLTAVLQKHYFNYNVRVMSSEEFMTRLLTDSRSEQGPVSDFVMEAAVSGWQTTNTNVLIDLKPSKTDARWNLILTGNVQSNTQGVTSQATVSTFGNHSFQAQKEIRFDGTRFTTGPGTINVNANNQTTGVATQYSGGLFGGFADRIAMREAEARRGQAEAIAASRIQDRVLPRFNQEVNDAFAKAGRDLQKDLFDHLRETKLYPDAMLFQTTDQELRANTRLMSETELGAGEAPTRYVTTNGATLLIHESVLNNGADRLELAGKTMTDEELRVHLEQFFSKALNTKFTIERPKEEPPAAGEEADEKPPGIFVFAAADPIRVRLDDGILTLILRTGFKRDNGEEIPQQVITVKLNVEVKGPKIEITRAGLVEVVAADGPTSIPTSNVIRTKIQKALPDRVVDGKVEVKGTRRTVNAYYTNIRFVDGWAAVNLR